MSYPELLGEIALTEPELQARVQAVIEREWPQWQRERALRIGGDDLALLNEFFDALSIEVDAARGYHAELAAALAADPGEQEGQA